MIVGLASAILGGLRPILPAGLVDCGLRHFLNNRYSNIGKLSVLRVDSPAGKVFMELELRGEPAPLQITIERYDVTESEGRLFIEILELHASREWVNALAPLVFKDRKFALHEFARLAFAA